MTFGLAPPQPPREPPCPRRLRVLCRVERRRQFRCQIITAAIYKHAHGQELRVYLEPAERNELLWSELPRWDFTPLEEKATRLREKLLELVVRMACAVDRATT